MDARHQQLLRQRAAIAEHLAWLDAEIARVAPAVASHPTPPDPAGPSSAERLPSATSHVPLASTPADPDQLLAQLGSDSEDSDLPSKTGCWGIFLGILLLVVGGGIGAIYIFYR